MEYLVKQRKHVIQNLKAQQKLIVDAVIMTTYVKKVIQTHVAVINVMQK